MASTVTNELHHLMFSTKGRTPLISISDEVRTPLISDEVRTPVYDDPGGIIRNQEVKVIEVGGMSDHVHCLARLPVREAVFDISRTVKSDSSGWVNREQPGDRFAWQTGYGAFTVSHSRVGKVGQSIRRIQKAHHREKSFEMEFPGLLK